MSEIKLPQLVNTVEIVGTVKAIDLQEAEAKVSKKKFIKGTVTVTSNHDGKVHEHKISVFQMEKNKKGDVTTIYKGIKTVMDEFKSIEALGEENADRIKVTGELDLEEYYNKQEQLVSFNKVKGVFFNRLEADSGIADKAIASIEVVVENFAPHADPNTGEILHHNVSAFTVGFGERVIELKKAIVSDALVGPMENLYVPGSTGRLTFKLNSFVETVEKDQQDTPVEMSHGFGSEEKPEGNTTFERRTNNLEITGGDLPFEEPKALSEEQIAHAKRSRALALEELKQKAANNAPETPAAPTGFGGAPDIQLPGNMEKGPITVPPLATPKPQSAPPTEIADEDIPDF
jgi:hypothetical protein